MLKIVRNGRRTEYDTEDDDDNEEEMPEDTGDRTYDTSERDGATNHCGPIRKMTYYKSTLTAKSHRVRTLNL